VPRVAALAHGLLRLLHRTLRVEVEGEVPADVGPVVFAFWHGAQQLILPYRPSSALKVMISRSVDGRLQAEILARFGIASVAGSSSRGGATALRTLVRAVNAGSHVGLTVDGPRGPRHRAKAGVLALAALTGAPIVPVRASTSRGWVLQSTWDRFVVPYPGAKIKIKLCDPFWVPRRHYKKMQVRLLQRLERDLGGDASTEGVNRS